MTTVPNPAPGVRPDDLVGLRVVLPSPCPRCRSSVAAIGAGKAMHRASLICQCERHLGWISGESFNFISETVRQFGRPSEPIAIRHNMPPAPRCESCGDTPEQTIFDFVSGPQAPHTEITETGPATTGPKGAEP